MTTLETLGSAICALHNHMHHEDNPETYTLLVTLDEAIMEAISHIEELEKPQITAEESSIIYHALSHYMTHCKRKGQMSHWRKWEARFGAAKALHGKLDDGELIIAALVNPDSSPGSTA